MRGRPAERYLDAQRAAHLRRTHELTELKRAGPLMDTLLADYGLSHPEADLHWIDTTTARLGDLAAPLTRGRPPDPRKGLNRWLIGRVLDDERTF